MSLTRSLAIFTLTALFATGAWAYYHYSYSGSHSPGNDSDTSLLLAEATPRSFHVHVNTVGELEAARSTIIASSIRGDLGKVIYLISDGVTVQPGDLLVKMDPSPFEEKLSELRSKIKDQSAHIHTLHQTLQWERNQNTLETKAAAFEVATTQLELKKTTEGDGPLELYRLYSGMKKALSKFEDLDAYSADLALMEEEGYLNHSERKQAEKKLDEERETYENAQMQYETYKDHVLPMQIKKAETAVRRAKLRQEEVKKTGNYKVEKAVANLRQAQQVKRELHGQYRTAQQELADSEIRAPAPGMVVLREEYRAGQKRKPRVGDIAVKNQPLLDLPDLGSMVIKTKVREVDLYKIAVGKPVLIEVDAYPHVFFKGTVQAIGVLALADLTRGSGEKYFELKIGLDTSDDRLRPGMTSRATILANQVQDTLTVPIHALFEIDKKTHCYVSSDHGYRLCPVTVGASNEQWVAITGGLSPGDKVCLSQPPQHLIVASNE